MRFQWIILPHFYIPASSPICRIPCRKSPTGRGENNCPCTCTWQSFRTPCRCSRSGRFSLPAACHSERLQSDQSINLNQTIPTGIPNRNRKFEATTQTGFMFKEQSEQNDAGKSSCFSTYTDKWAVRRPTSRQCCRLGPAGPTKRFRDCRGSPRLSRLSPACARSTSRWPAWPEVDRKSLWMYREGEKTDGKRLFYCWYFAGPCEEKTHWWNVDYLDKLDSGRTRRPGTGRLVVRDPLTYNPVRRCTRACYWGCNRFPWSTPYWWIPEHRNLFFFT